MQMLVFFINRRLMAQFCSRGNIRPYRNGGDTKCALQVLSGNVVIFLKEKNVQSIFTFQYEEDRIMRKIKSRNRDNKDRIICVSDSGKHRFLHFSASMEDALMALVLA